MSAIEAGPDTLFRGTGCKDTLRRLRRNPYQPITYDPLYRQLSVMASVLHMAIRTGFERGVWVPGHAAGMDCQTSPTLLTILISSKYWDWATTAKSGLTNGPMLDGSDTSMSGQGAYVPGRGDIVLGGAQGLPPVILPPGPGDGCVPSGPFKNMSVNLGPASLSAPGNVTIVNPDGPLSYNPRCLRRSLTDEVNRAYANGTSILKLLLEPQNVYDFQMQMQGVPGSGDIGVHGGG